MLDYLKNEIQDFSERQFGERHDPKGPLNHLKEEVDELIEAIDIVKSPSAPGATIDEAKKLMHNEEEEWADCLLLLLDAFRIRFGNDVSFNKLLHFSLNKLEVIKDRKWDKKPNKDGIYRSEK